MILYRILYRFFFSTGLTTLICSCWAARRVDANARARDTMKRRQEGPAFTKRHQAETLDTKELLQLTEGSITICMLNKCVRSKQVYNGH